MIAKNLEVTTAIHYCNVYLEGPSHYVWFLESLKENMRE